MPESGRRCNSTARRRGSTPRPVRRPGSSCPTPGRAGRWSARAARASSPVRRTARSAYTRSPAPRNSSGPRAFGRVRRGPRPGRASPAARRSPRGSPRWGFRGSRSRDRCSAPRRWARTGRPAAASVRHLVHGGPDEGQNLGFKTIRARIANTRKSATASTLIHRFASPRNSLEVSLFARIAGGRPGFHEPLHLLSRRDEHSVPDPGQQDVEPEGDVDPGLPAEMDAREVEEREPRDQVHEDRGERDRSSSHGRERVTGDRRSAPASEGGPQPEGGVEQLRDQRDSARDVEEEEQFPHWTTSVPVMPVWIVQR